jgi:RNA polymerase-binding transcription factor DksA
MRPAEIERLQAQLREMETRLLADRSRLVHQESMSAETGELVDFDMNHPADAGSDLYEREKEIAFAENIDEMLSLVRQALAKIENGTYGRCDLCGGAIAPARLAALPYASLCIACQSRMEG